jgi:hypothetical protein
MADIEVSGPDGSTFSFPEGTGADIINSALQKHYGGAAAQPSDQRVKAATWSDVPIAALKNTPADVQEFGSNIVDAVKNFPQTAENLYGLGKGLYSKAEGALGVEQNPDQKAQNETTANAFGQMILDKYGSMDKFRNSLAEHPVQTLADISIPFTGGGSVLGRAPGIIGDVGKIASTIGSVTDPLSVATKAAGMGGKVAAKSLGLTTGVGGETVEQAFKAGQNGKTAFLDQMRGSGDASNLVDMALKHVDDLRDARQADYLSNTNELRAGGGAARLSVAPIDQAVNNTESIFKQGNFVKNKAAEAVHDEIGNVIDEWKAANSNPTPMDYDALKQRIGQIDAGNAAAEAVRTQVYNAIQQQLSVHVPQYAKAMKGYEDASNNLQQLRKTFSLNGNVSTDTASRKILSILRDNVNTNYGQRSALGQQIADANPDFLPAIAGQTMRSIEPRGLSRLLAGGGILESLHNPYSLAALPLTSPRLVGEAAYKAGQAANMMPSPTTLNMLQQIGRLDRNQPLGLLGQ